jgi:hypothetical protein
MCELRNDRYSHQLISAIFLALICLPLPAFSQTMFDEMLGRYRMIYDSTSIWPDGRGGYDYSRKFISEAILDEEGRSVLSRPATPILSKNDKININAFTLLPSGETLQVEPADMVTRDLSGDRRWIFVNFRQAEPGAVVHMEWSLSTKDANIAGKRYLGRTVPVEKATIVLTAPETWRFNFAVTQGTEYLQKANIVRGAESEIGRTNYYWTGINITGLTREEYSPSLDRIIPCMYYSFFYDTSWDNPDSNRIDWRYLSRLYSRQIDDFSRYNSPLKAVADSISRLTTDKRIIAQSAYDWVGSHFRVVDNDITISGDIEQALQRGRGTQAEASSIMLALFKKLQISTKPFLIATRDSGEPIMSLPALFWFDRMLLNVEFDNDTLWVDPSYQLTKMDILPFEDMGVKGLDVSGGGWRFMTIPVADYRENGKAIHLNLDFDSTGSMRGEATEIYSGAMIPEITTFMQSLDTGDERIPWEKKLAKSFPNAKIERFIIMPPDSATQAYRIGYTFTTGPLVRPLASRAYIPMDLLGRWADLPVLPTQARQFSLELRRPRFELERITLKISPKFEVEFLPSNYSENDEIGEIYSVAKGDKNSVTITRGFGLKSPMLPISEYASLRKFIGRARTEADKHLILKRVNY